MKAKISRGKSFAGLIRYTEDFGRKATGQKRPELICSTLVADTGRGRVRELVKIASVRPDVEKPVWHCSLSLPPGDHLEPEKWESVVRDFLQGMGMNPDRQPYFAVQHHDTEHEHVHIVLSRVSEDGSLFYGQREAIEAIKVTQELEVKHDLTRTTGLYKRDKSQLKGAEINKALRTGKAPTRLKLQSAIDNCLSGREVTATEFVTTLEAMGVTVTPNISNTGKLSGFAFEADGVTFKGSQLGKGYGLKGLLEKGLTYEQDRESGTLKRVRDRSAERTRSQDHHLERHNAPVAENDRDEIAKRTTDYHTQTIVMDKATDNLIKIQDTMKSTTQEIVNHSQAMANYTSRLPTKKDLLGTLTAFCVLGVMLGALIGVAMTYFVYIPGQETQERAETMDRLIALSTPEEIQKMNEILQRTSRPSTNKRSD